MSNPAPFNPNYELTKAFLFLRTAFTAVTNTKAQIESTKKYVQWNSINGYYSEHMAYEAEQEQEEVELRKWKARLVDAGLQIVDWTAKIQLGRCLPREILGLIAEMLRRDDELV